jgi:hypothetical protein
MSNLYEILANAQNGEAIDRLAHQFDLTHEEAENAVAALLPAISRGLKQSTATPEGLGGLLSLAAQQRDLYDDQELAFGDTGRSAGNDALGAMFGSKDVSRAVAAQAQHATGIGAGILKQMLPVIIGMVLSGLLKNLGGGSAQGQPMPAPQPSPGAPGGGMGGGLGDVLGEILGGRMPGGQSPGGGLSPFPFPLPDGRGAPQQPGPSQGPGGGDILGQILRDMLGGGGPSGGPAAPNSRDLKDLSDLSNKLPFAGGYGEALFGDALEPGHDVDRQHEQNVEQLFDSFFGGRR